MKTFFLSIIAIISLLFLYSFQTKVVSNFKSKNYINSTLNDKEILFLKHMREEEKLARDVYQHFAEKYDFFVFKNIVQSEQRHMEIMLQFLTDNQIADPASTKSGVFNNTELQKLYNQLIAQGDVSLTEALKVGATIEDLDIKDLMTYKNETSNSLILNSLDNLTCGSRNHLRAFVSQLEVKDVNYTPQFISTEVFKSIIDDDHEKCAQMGNNNFKNTNFNKSNKKNNKGKGNCINK